MSMSAGDRDVLAEVHDHLGLEQLRGTSWAVDIRDTTTGTTLIEIDNHRLLKCASLGKLYLLIEVAAQLIAGDIDPLSPLDRRSVAPVADSGLWQHLACDVLPVVDAAHLVGSLSDNLATNVLLELVGLEAVQARAAYHAVDGSRLNDRVRDVRAEGDAPTLSVGSAADWASLLAGLHRGTIESRLVSELVMTWLAAGTDLSMVASAFGLDPLSHAGTPDRGITLWNKTGTDRGVRADAGIIRHDNRAFVYAVVCNWDPQTQPDPRDAVLTAMHRIGQSLSVRLCRGSDGNVT